MYIYLHVFIAAALIRGEEAPRRQIYSLPGPHSRQRRRRILRCLRRHCWSVAAAAAAALAAAGLAAAALAAAALAAAAALGAGLLPAVVAAPAVPAAAAATAGGFAERGCCFWRQSIAAFITQIPTI